MVKHYLTIHLGLGIRRCKNIETAIVCNVFDVKGEVAAGIKLIKLNVNWYFVFNKFFFLLFSETMASSNPDSAPTKESQVETGKKNVSFDIYGNLIDEQKAKIKARSLSLAKSHVGLTYDDWRHVPTALKDDMWNSLSKDFGLEPVYKENIMSQASVQWKAWKKNIRTHHFGKTRQEVMEWKDKVPPGETVPLAEWNIFVEREATPKKLEQRAKARENRAKKKDVHLLGSKSYAQVTTEWTVCDFLAFAY